MGVCFEREECLICFGVFFFFFYMKNESNIYWEVGYGVVT